MGITDGNGNKTRLNLGSGMGMNHWEWDGMGLKKTFPHTSRMLAHWAESDYGLSTGQHAVLPEDKGTSRLYIV